MVSVNVVRTNKRIERKNENLGNYAPQKGELRKLKKKKKVTLNKKLSKMDKRFITTCPINERPSPLKPCRSLLMARMRRRNAKILRNKQKQDKEISVRRHNTMIRKRKAESPRNISHRITGRSPDRQIGGKYSTKKCSKRLKSPKRKSLSPDRTHKKHSRLAGGTVLNGKPTAGADQTKPGTTSVLYVIDDRNYSGRKSYKKLRIEALRKHQDMLQVKRKALTHPNQQKFTKPGRNRNSSQLHFFMNMGQRKKRCEAPTPSAKMPKIMKSKTNPLVDYQSHMFDNNNIYNNSMINNINNKNNNMSNKIMTGASAGGGKNLTYGKNIVRKNINEIDVPLTAHVPIIDITPVARGTKKLLERESHKYFQKNGMHSPPAFYNQRTFPKRAP